MPIRQFEITSNRWISHYLLVCLLGAVIDLVSVEHRVRCDVLQGRLQLSSDHDVLLH